jgi:hypothetical protein
LPVGLQAVVLVVFVLVEPLPPPWPAFTVVVEEMLLMLLELPANDVLAVVNVVIEAAASVGPSVSPPNAIPYPSATATAAANAILSRFTRLSYVIEWGGGGGLHWRRPPPERS